MPRTVEPRTWPRSRAASPRSVRSPKSNQPFPTRLLRVWRSFRPTQSPRRSRFPPRHAPRAPSRERQRARRPRRARLSRQPRRSPSGRALPRLGRSRSMRTRSKASPWTTLCPRRSLALRLRRPPRLRSRVRGDRRPVFVAIPWIRDGTAFLKESLPSLAWPGHLLLRLPRRSRRPPLSRRRSRGTTSSWRRTCPRLPPSGSRPPSPRFTRCRQCQKWSLCRPRLSRRWWPQRRRTPPTATLPRRRIVCRPVRLAAGRFRRPRPHRQ